MKLFSFWSKSLWPWEIKAIDVHSKICFYNNPWPLLLYLGNANFYRMMVKIQIWKINFFIYLLRDWKTWKVFASFFLCTYKRGFLFLHIWLIASTQLWSISLLRCGRNTIRQNQENVVPSGSSSHSLLLDGLEGLVV